MTFSKFLLATCFIALFHNVASSVQGIRPKPLNASNPQTELKHVSLLLLDEGVVEEFGFMKLPLKVLNEYALQPAQETRVRKWDVFHVTGNDFYLSAQVASFESTGLLRVNFFDFKTGKSIEFSVTPTGDDIPQLSHSTYRYTNGSTDNVIFESKDVVFKVENEDYDFESPYFKRRIQLISAAHEINLDLNIQVITDHEAVIALTPLDNSNKHFYYDIRSGNLPTKGLLKVGDKEYPLLDDNVSSGQDFGRGVWTDSNYILKARGQGFTDHGKRFSILFSSGYENPETCAASADGFIVDKFSFKLNTVGVEIDESDLTKQIKFKTLFNKLKNFKEANVVFTPSHAHKQAVNEATTDFESHVIIGEFAGYVTDYKNKKYTFDGLKGSVELIKLRVQPKSQ